MEKKNAIVWQSCAVRAWFFEMELWRFCVMLETLNIREWFCFFFICKTMPLQCLKISRPFDSLNMVIFWLTEEINSVYFHSYTTRRLFIQWGISNFHTYTTRCSYHAISWMFFLRWAGTFIMCAKDRTKFTSPAVLLWWMSFYTRLVFTRWRWGARTVRSLALQVRIKRGSFSLKVLEFNTAVDALFSCFICLKRLCERKVLNLFI
jgi:hypothetical protein